MIIKGVEAVMALRNSRRPLEQNEKTDKSSKSDDDMFDEMLNGYMKDLKEKKEDENA